MSGGSRSISLSTSFLLLRVLCSVRRWVTALDCVLSKDSFLFLTDGLVPEINFLAYFWVLIRPPYIAVYVGFPCSISSFFPGGNVFERLLALLCKLGRCFGGLKRFQSRLALRENTNVK